MRSLSLHYASIQIASIAGESRRVKVSGLAKARLLWLFRNFSILEFPVLNRQQQQLIDRMWSSGRRVPSKEAPRDVIGKIEAFSPKPCEQETGALIATPVRRASIEQASGEKLGGKISQRLSSEKPCSKTSGAPRMRFPLLRASLRGAATWRAFTILLLGAAMYFGPRFLPPKHPHAPQTQVAAVDDQKQRARSVPAAPEAPPAPRSSAKALAAKPAAPIAAKPANVAVAAPMVTPAPMVARVLPPVTPNASSPGDSAKASKAAPMVAARVLPEAMAHESSMSQAASPQPRSMADSGPQEVLIRVSVNAAGQAQRFEIVQGDHEKQGAALQAARLWNFKPCAGGQACNQVLKFTDYGDSHRVQRIE